MKIALLTEGFFWNSYAEAGNITIKMLSDFLTERGNDVHIITKKYPGQLTREDHGKLKIRRITENKGAAINGFSKEIKNAVEENGKDFDIIHTFSSSPLLTLRGVISKRYSKKSKLVHTIKANTEYKSTYLITAILNLNNIVTASTDFLKEKLTSFGCMSSKIKTIPSYIDTNKFRPKNKDNLRSKYGYRWIKTIVYYGHMNEKKGIIDLIKATDILKKEGKKNILTLLVTGSKDAYIKPFADIISKMKLREEIKIIKTTKNIEDYVNLANVVVLPYPNLISTEAQPSCILETMAAKTPLITTELKELRELLSDDEVIFVKPHNEKDLATKIQQVIENKLNKKMIENAYKKALNFDYKKILPEFLKIYEELAE